MPDFIVTLRGRPVEQLSLNLIEINIGRSPDNDIVLPNQSVSRKHATISSINQGYYIRALNNQNPIMVNGEECRQLVKLNSQDTIQVGKYMITVSNLNSQHSMMTGIEDTALTHALSREHLENYAQEDVGPAPSIQDTRLKQNQMLIQQVKNYQLLLILSLLINIYFLIWSEPSPAPITPATQVEAQPEAQPETQIETQPKDEAKTQPPK